jgi:hypothetical protein
MSPGQKHYVLCPHCGCKLRAGRYSGHLLRVHKQKTNSAEIARIITRMANKQPSSKRQNRPARLAGPEAVRQAEKDSEAVIARLVNKPHKCTTPGCTNSIPASEAFCDPCKGRKTYSLSKMVSVPKGKGFCSCGNPALPGETSCYECIGD